MLTLMREDLSCQFNGRKVCLEMETEMNDLVSHQDVSLTFINDGSVLSVKLSFQRSNLLFELCCEEDCLHTTVLLIPTITIISVTFER